MFLTINSTRTLFPMLNILSLSSIYKLRLGLFMYKVHLELQPINILRLFHVNIDVHNHDTIGKGNIFTHQLEKRITSIHLFTSNPLSHRIKFCLSKKILNSKVNFENIYY